MRPPMSFSMSGHVLVSCDHTKVSFSKRLFFPFRCFIIWNLDKSSEAGMRDIKDRSRDNPVLSRSW